MRKTIHVAAAVIREGDRIFATQRGYGPYKDWWEFPGGKLEAGETPEEALIREIREELDTEIRVEAPLGRVEYDYPEFHLVMDCYWCSVRRGELVLREAEDALWLDRNSLRSVKWLPADLELLERIETGLEQARLSAEQEVRLIALDLDGTLLHRDKSLSPANREALFRAAEKGVEIVPATGRFYGAIPEEVLELPFVRYAITINGAEVFDIGRGTGIYAGEIPKDRAMEVFRLLDGYPLIYDCYQSGAAWMERPMYDRVERYAPDPITLRLLRTLRTPVEDLKKFVMGRLGDVQKIQLFAEPDVREELRRRLREEFPELKVTSALRNNLEINGPKGDKGLALRALAGYLGLPENSTMAIGDGSNDISMLQAAALPVAMGNAAPEVRALGCFTTTDCDEDGVAAALKHFGLV